MNIPDGVKRIDYCAFWYCRSLESLDIPDSYSEELWNTTIEGCTGLKKLKLSKNISKIKENLSGLTSLQEVNINNGSANYMSEDGVLYNKDKTELICYPNDKQQGNYVMPDNLTEIPRNFSNKNLKSITLSKNITNWGCSSENFENLQELNVNEDNLNYSSENGVLYDKDKTELICYPNDKQQENYVVPESVVEIANNIESKNIKSITLSKNVREIISGGFENCINLEMINVDNNNQYYISEDGILYNKEKTVLICYPNNKKEQSYVMPDSLTEIPRDFSNKNLKSITLSKNITNWGCSSENFENLQELNVNENNSNYSSENGVLFNKDKTTLLGYPRNKEGESYVIPTSVTEIGTPFGNPNNVITNKNLKNITITRNVSEIYCDFSYCANLQNIDVDSENQNFTSEEGVLFYKDKLALMAYPSGKTQTSYIIPDGVEALLRFNCINLKELVIPSSVVGFVMDDAFSGCPDLKVVIKKGSSLTMEYLEKSGLSESQITFEN